MKQTLKDIQQIIDNLPLNKRPDAATFKDSLYECFSVYGDLFEAWYAGLPKADYASPASSRFHHNYPGGVLVHCGQMIEVYRSIRGMYELEGYAADATFMELAIVLHDHFKMVDGHYKTEGEKIVATLGRDHLKEMTDHLKSHAMLFLTPDEGSELIHMIGSHHGRMNWGCVEEPRTASANLLHQLDMISAKCLGEWK